MIHHRRIKLGVGIALPSQVTSNSVGNSSSLVTAAQLTGVYAYASTTSGPTCSHSRLCCLIRMAEAAVDLQRQRPLDGPPRKLLGGHRRPALRAVCREATCMDMTTTLDVHLAHIRWHMCHQAARWMKPCLNCIWTGDALECTGPDMCPKVVSGHLAWQSRC
jgi:hypothetical protein